MFFKNRKDAGMQMADRLEQQLFRKSGNGKEDLIVVGLPRGGVPVALECARRFGCRLELIVTKKIPFPGHYEDSIGAVSSDGLQKMNHDFKEKPTWKGYVMEESKMLSRQCHELEDSFYKKAGYNPVSFEDKIVVIVDDGIATGATAASAIESARKRGARRIVMAAPVIGPANYHDFCCDCEDVFALHICEEFSSLAKFYENFDEVSNDEVVKAMRESAEFAPVQSTTRMPVVSF